MTLSELIERVEKLDGPDRDVDEAIVEAMGGHVRRVSRLGLNGRSPGSYRAFFSHSDPNKGSAIPYYTKSHESRVRAIAKLSALSAQERDDG